MKPYLTTGLHVGKDVKEETKAEWGAWVAFTQSDWGVHKKCEHTKEQQRYTLHRKEAGYSKKDKKKVPCSTTEASRHSKPAGTNFH